MARERAFTDQQIIDAANELTLSGKNINGTSLRNKVGAGRPSTLFDVYQQLNKKGSIAIHTEPTEQQPEITQQMLPAEIDSMLSVALADIENIVQQINNNAHYVIEQRLNSAINEANERAADAAKRQAEVEIEMESAFNHVEDMREELEATKENETNTNKQNQELKQALEISKNETKAEAKAKKERDERIQELEATLKEALEQKAEAETAKAKAEGEASAINRALSDKKADCEELKQEVKLLEESQKTKLIESTELRTEIKQLKEKQNKQHVSSYPNFDELKFTEEQKTEVKEKLDSVSQEFKMTTEQRERFIEHLNTRETKCYFNLRSLRSEAKKTLKEIIPQ